MDLGARRSSTDCCSRCDWTATVRPGVALDGKIIQIPDVLADPEYHVTDHQQAFGYRTILGVPLLRDGAMIGVLSLTRDVLSPSPTSK